MRRPLAAQDAAHERRLHEIDEAVAAYERWLAAELRRQHKAQAAAERQAQAEALARALRRG